MLFSTDVQQGLELQVCLADGDVDDWYNEAGSPLAGDTGRGGGFGHSAQHSAAVTSSLNIHHHPQSAYWAGAGLQRHSIRGCSQMTSAFFGVSDTPWCFKLMTSFVNSNEPKTIIF